MKCPVPEVKYTKARLRADEFIKNKSAISPFASSSVEFKLKRFQNIQARIDDKR